jgi:hypothetical protein
LSFSAAGFLTLKKILSPSRCIIQRSLFPLFLSPACQLPFYETLPRRDEGPELAQHHDPPSPSWTMCRLHSVKVCREQYKGLLYTYMLLNQSDIVKLCCVMVREFWISSLPEHCDATTVNALIHERSSSLPHATTRLKEHRLRRAGYHRYSNFSKT